MSTNDMSKPIRGKQLSFLSFSDCQSPFLFTFLTVGVSVLVKLTKPCELGTVQMYSFTVLGGGSLNSKCRQGRAPCEAWRAAASLASSQPLAGSRSSHPSARAAAPPPPPVLSHSLLPSVSPHGCLLLASVVLGQDPP